MVINKYLCYIQSKLEKYYNIYKEEFDLLTKSYPRWDMIDDILKYYFVDNIKWSSFVLYSRYKDVGFIKKNKDKYILVYGLYRYINYMTGLLLLRKKIILVLLYRIHNCKENPIPELSYIICDDKDEKNIYWKTMAYKWINKYINYYKQLLKELELDKDFCVRNIYNKEEKENIVVIDLKKDYKYKKSICNMGVIK